MLCFVLCTVRYVQSLLSVLFCAWDNNRACVHHLLVLACGVSGEALVSALGWELKAVSFCLLPCFSLPEH